MSYLDSPRLHFLGKFFANPSTINNTLSNFDLTPPLDLSWNPDGSAFFQFQGCSVSSAVGKDGTVIAPGSTDPILKATLSTPLSPPTSVAKIVDLDPDQQSITQLYGVVVTLTLPGGQGSVSGRLAISELRDLWFARVSTPGSDEVASGIWQSVLTGLTWSGRGSSPFLDDLYAASPESLSIKFNTDAYDLNSASPTFNQGRLAGTIGPYVAGEPVQFIMGRRLVPANPAYFPAPFQVSKGGERLVFDLGNSMPLAVAGGAVAGPSTLNAAILDAQGNVATVFPTAIDASSAAYAVNSGVCEVPLTADQASQAATSPIGLVASGTTVPLLAEAGDGRYVNLEPFSLRLNPGQSGTVTLRAAGFGQPLGGLELPIGFDAPGFTDENTPAAAIQFPSSVTTAASGQVSIPISASSPRPLPARRSSIGSQVYFLGGPWEAWGQISLEAATSILIFDDPPAVANPTWTDVQPVLNQYAVLYPAMRKRIDLSKYEEVQAHSADILDAISLPIEDPAYMPVTRDLSASHQQLLKTWIGTGCPR